MTKKKKEKSPPGTVLNVRGLNADLLSIFKSIAARHRMKVSDAVTEALTEWCNRHDYPGLVKRRKKERS